MKCFYKSKKKTKKPKGKKEEISKNNSKRVASNNRRAHRYSLVGREFEGEVARLLASMQDNGLISFFVAHRAHSMEDGDGKDFTVVIKDVAKSFGVTISNRSHKNSRMKHPLTPQLHFPIGTKPETIRKRILCLFKEVD